MEIAETIEVARIQGLEGKKGKEIQGQGGALGWTTGLIKFHAIEMKLPIWEGGREPQMQASLK